MSSRLKGSVLSKGSMCALLLVSVTLAAFGQDIGWGPTVSGLRVGVAIESTELSVVFENVAAVRQDLLIEQQPGGYSFSIRAVEGPYGEQFPVRSAVDPGGSGRLVPIGLVIPIVVSIPPGRMYEVRMPLRILLAIAPGDAGFESLLQQGYKVRIGYPVSRSGARLAIYKYPDLWTGDIDSAAVGYRGR